MNKIKTIINQMFHTFGYSLSKIKNTQELSGLNEEDLSEYKIITELSGCLGPDAFKLFKNISRLENQRIEAIIEIGVFCGRSLISLACAFKNATVTGIDPFYDDFHNSPAFEDEAEYLKSKAGVTTREQRIKKIWLVAEKFKDLKHRIKLETVTQESFLAKNNKQFNLIHIDGEHTFKAVDDIINSFNNILPPDSLVIVDDMPNPGFPGISQAVYTHNDFNKKLFTIFYGFNKAIFLFNPSNKEKISSLRDGLHSLYSNRFYSIRLQHDGSILVSKKR